MILGGENAYFLRKNAFFTFKTLLNASILCQT